LAGGSLPMLNESSQSRQPSEQVDLIPRSHETAPTPVTYRSPEY
jgi:hypothetical protein